MPNARPTDATLLDVLIDGFEKNEILDGWHDRVLPLPDEVAAIAKHAELVAEATCWKGPPDRRDDVGPHRLAVWADLEILQADRGILVRARDGRFRDWWYEDAVWAARPLEAVWAWVSERMPR